jgi:hypothetical protein
MIIYQFIYYPETTGGKYILYDPTDEVLNILAPVVNNVNKDNIFSDLDRPSLMSIVQDKNEMRIESIDMPEELKEIMAQKIRIMIDDDTVEVLIVDRPTGITDAALTTFVAGRHLIIHDKLIIMKRIENFKRTMGNMIHKNHRKTQYCKCSIL